MKKILLILVLFFTSWMTYEAINIWILLDSPRTSIWRLRLYDRNGKTLADLPKSWGYSVHYEWDLDSRLIESIIQIEDQRFFSHYGIDIIGKLWALRENYSAGKTVRGGSTISEQYIKNIYFPNIPRTLSQKITESLWAIVLETKYSKEEILKKYLDSLYMGNGIYGLQWALDIYFSDEKIATLSDSSLIEIITRIKYPNTTEGSIEYKNLLAQKLRLPALSSIIPKREKPEYKNLFPFLTDRIESEISRYCQGMENTLENYILRIPIDLCKRSDISLITSIDMRLNNEASSLLESTLSPLEEKNIHNGSIYIWSEKEKKVLVYIGNRENTQENAIDMITRRRSVGSVLKPFVYLLALRRWADPDSLILDESKVYKTGKNNQSFVPENYIPKSYGPIPLREGLGNSLNSATVRLSEYLGIGHIYDFYRSSGLDLDHDAGYYGYGISLGAVELTLENIVHGYRTFLDLENSDNFLLFDILSDSGNRLRTFWISSILNTSIPLAVKTGTSTDFHDNWTIGYNKDIIVGIWVGNTNNETMDDVSWITGAGPIYHAMVETLIAYSYVQYSPLSPPSNIRLEYICQDKNCLQKKSAYIRNGFSQKSRPLSNLYFEKDFFTPLTLEEKKKWKIE